MTKQSPALSSAETEILRFVWQLEAVTVQQICDAISKDRPVHYATVQTLLRRLEKKGYVQHVKEGRAHVYAPLVGKQEATRFEIKNLVGRFFKDSHELLVLNLLEDKSIDAEELKRLSQLLQEQREKS